MGVTTHDYTATLAWEGSTALGYEHYDRGHAAGVGGEQLELSADPSFGGDPARLNPEQLLLAAASSCQLLSFLAVAARARLDVVGYRDAAQAVMDEADPPLRVGRITLRPEVTVRGDVPDSRIHHLLEVAHRECFVARSLTSEVVIEATVVRAT
ncbi:OsmC family protein [Janibacter melonis]|uniref:Osmotically inducible protein OsmC n=1 Tax=Janibacter melonis TaxID=262209 RepID=A0A176QE02_9MICO|nr:osmotically inducible protein OsmC [Janibacter melonis]